MNGLAGAVARVEAGERIDVADARTLWTQASDAELGRLAGLVRARWHQPDHATYMVMRIINYTNVCVAQCDYCAFYVLPNQDGGYVLSQADVFAKYLGAPLCNVPPPPGSKATDMADHFIGEFFGVFAELGIQRI